MRRPLTAIAISCAVLTFATAPAQQRTARETLSEQPQSWDRSQLLSSPAIASVDGEPAALRCATRPVSDAEKDLVDIVVASELAPRDSATQAGRITVPVAFHVVRKKNGSYDVTDQQVDDQMAVLNAAFSSKGFKFELQTLIRHDDNRFATKCVDLSVERKFKNKQAVDPANTLNVYTCRPTNSILGYAWFPNDWEGEANPMHGVL